MYFCLPIMRVKIIILFVALAIVPDILFGQCSMCRLMAESSYESGSEIGRGLNDGISYIMGMPYIILAVGAYLLFKKRVGK